MLWKSYRHARVTFGPTAWCVFSAPAHFQNSDEFARVAPCTGSGRFTRLSSSERAREWTATARLVHSTLAALAPIQGRVRATEVLACYSRSACVLLTPVPVPGSTHKRSLRATRCFGAPRTPTAKIETRTVSRHSRVLLGQEMKPSGMKSCRTPSGRVNEDQASPQHHSSTVLLHLRTRRVSAVSQGQCYRTPVMLPYSSANGAHMRGAQLDAESIVHTM